MASLVLPELRLTRQVDNHPSLLICLSHAGVGSLQLRRHLFHLPKQQVAQTLEHDCSCCQVPMTQVLLLLSKTKAVAASLNVQITRCCFMRFFDFRFKWSPFAGSRSFDKRTRVGFCSAKVRFHLVWSKGLERHGERERQKDRRQLVTVNTVNRVVPKKKTSEREVTY